MTNAVWSTVVNSLNGTNAEMMSPKKNYARAILYEDNRSWAVTIDEEFWHDTSLHEGYAVYPATRWAEKQLKTWPHCKQLNPCTWKFGSKQDAEKFTVMFYLKWPM